MVGPGALTSAAAASSFTASCFSHNYPVQFWGGGGSNDVESGLPLYPGIDSMDNALRWGFVRKVRLWEVLARARPECRRVSSEACARCALLGSPAASRLRARLTVGGSFASLPLLHSSLPQRSPPPGPQVYGIISMQLVLTTLVAAAVVASPSAQHFLLTNWGLQLGLLLLSMLGLIPLYAYRQSHPTNLILLGCWTPLFSGW